MLHDINRLIYGLIGWLAGWLAALYAYVYTHGRACTDSIQQIQFIPFYNLFLSIDVSVYTIRFSWYNSDNNNNDNKADGYCCSFQWCSFAGTDFQSYMLMRYYAIHVLGAFPLQFSYYHYFIGYLIRFVWNHINALINSTWMNSNCNSYAIYWHKCIDFLIF